MIITRGYGIESGGTGPCDTLILIDGLGITLDNSLYNINIDNDYKTVYVYNGFIDLIVDQDDINARLDNESVDVDILSDGLIVELQCGSTLIPKDEIMQKITGEDVGGFRAVTTDSNGHIIHATVARILEGKPVIGVTTQAAQIGNLCNVAITGDEIIELSWTWDLTESLYVGENGVLTQVPPTENFSQIVAVPLTSTSMRMRVEPPIFL